MRNPSVILRKLHGEALERQGVKLCHMLQLTTSRHVYSSMQESEKHHPVQQYMMANQVSRCVTG